MTINDRELHLKALEMGLEAAIGLVRDLPDTDAVFEIESFLAMNIEILDDIHNGYHFGHRNLRQYIDYCGQMQFPKNAHKE